MSGLIYIYMYKDVVVCCVYICGGFMTLGIGYHA